MRTARNWRPGNGTSLYVHVPFCVVKCGYCDFNSYADDDRASHERFLSALELELARVLNHEDSTPTVFLGGGTPTFLGPDLFEHLFALLDEHVDLSACHEVTMEANPESLTLDKAKIARAAGVTRFSVGAQSFDREKLAFLDRAHDADAIRRAVETLRVAGADNVSLDLMFSLPGQTLREWETDLDAALALRPDHISCYNLTFEPGTRLTRDLKNGHVLANDAEHDLALFEHTRHTLRSHGFDAYEVSNFAGRGGPCLHNDHYWLQGNYVGVGPGASSHRDGFRSTNLKVVESWASALDREEAPFGDTERLDSATRAAEAVWLGLRRADGVDLAAIEARTGFSATTAFEPLLSRYEALGYLDRDRDRLKIPESATRFTDSLATAFLQFEPASK